MRNEVAADGAQIVVAVEEPRDGDDLRLRQGCQFRFECPALRVVHRCPPIAERTDAARRAARGPRPPVNGARRDVGYGWGSRGGPVADTTLAPRARDATWPGRRRPCHW